MQKGICFNDTNKKKYNFPQRRYLEWTERRGDNDKEYTSTEGKIGQI